MTCFDAIDLMGQALEGRVPESSRPGFDEHLVECGPCRNYYSQLTVTVHALERLQRETDAAPAPAQRDRLLRRFRDQHPRTDA
jgi:predicted anti-sigma-YlaC factor YlaD